MMRGATKSDFDVVKPLGISALNTGRNFDGTSSASQTWKATEHRAAGLTHIGGWHHAAPLAVIPVAIEL